MTLYLYLEPGCYVAKWGDGSAESAVCPLDADAEGLPLAQQAIYALADVLPQVSAVSGATPGTVALMARDKGDCHRFKAAIRAIASGDASWPPGPRALAAHLRSRGCEVVADLRTPQEDAAIRRLAQRVTAEELTIGAGGVLSRLVAA
jgi:hypothetical protein